MEIFTLSITLLGNSSKWMRKIEVKENFTLSKLHEYIQDVVEFDNDHLYEFQIYSKKNKFLNKLSSSIKLNNIFPLEDTKLVYLFDFGDEWYFHIKKLVKNKPVDPKVKYPRIIEKKGKNPEQYPDWDDEEYE